MFGAGGLGHIGIQLLAALSAATVIVVDRSPEALEFAKTIGADHGVVADGSQVDQVKELTGGNGAEAGAGLRRRGGRRRRTPGR